MNNQNAILKKISIDKIFKDESKYIIPIYQRNYAWTNDERKQLIEDILDLGDNEEYFLGNLIVYEREENIFEVIDGQQRLTTLFILMKSLGENLEDGKLSFEAREKANHTLKNLNDEVTLNEFYSQEIIDAFKFFKQQPEIFKEDKVNIKKNFSAINILRIKVPKDTDLNHYFEIMNTRGKQLELHEILKARLMNCLKTNKEKKVFSTVWNACANMERYIQMSLEIKVRKRIFSNSYDNFLVNNFNELERVFDVSNNENMEKLEGLSFDDAMRIYDIDPYEEDNENENTNRFESIISFPNFLLQTLKVYKDLKRNDNNEEDGELDDKQLLDLFQIDYEFSKDFCFLLLKNRYLFDQYIIKREYKGQQVIDGAWSLKTLINKKQSKDGKYTPRYINTFGKGNSQSIDDGTEDTKKIRQLQSMLRITYTTPKVMHWVTKALIFLNINDVNNIKATDFVNVLEKYAINKVKESNYEIEKGFGIKRIVFTFLDYLLWRDGYTLNGKNFIEKSSEKFIFTYRNSIEHFYPQNPDETENQLKLNDDILHSFGNLCLVTVSSNSKFSNQLPVAKRTNEVTIENSLKLKIMAKITEEEGWDIEQINRHKEEMFKILHVNTL